ncbi:myc box-dependent-interacting protein 1-like isoform X2 [Watersipora subatra]|uniref:myc box-dependent-interacting protein 1-like isoform X2 n=1 Tax=Watersipora subatra TaxID=2589382 RepID=UPI00355AF263
MSEASRGGNSSGGALAKAVQKTLTRTKTKVLQRVGKAEKTTDDAYKDNINAFQKQQAAAIRLQKEMKHYLSCVKAMTVAAKGLFAVMKETYEEDWYDPHSFNSSLNSLELLHVSYEAELAERVSADINDYTDQFPIYKAHETLLDTKSLFEEINNELHRELPKFHDYRVEFLSTNFLRLCNAESTFHTNVGKVHDDLAKVLETLAKSHSEEMDKLSRSPQNLNTSIASQGGGEGLDLSSLSAADVRSPTNANGHRGDGYTHTPSKDRPQKVSAGEAEHHVRAPPPARPSTTPQSPASSNAGNPFATHEDEELKEKDNLVRKDASERTDHTERENSLEMDESSRQVVSEEKDDSENKDDSRLKDDAEQRDDSGQKDPSECKDISEQGENLAELKNSVGTNSNGSGNPFEDDSGEEMPDEIVLPVEPAGAVELAAAGEEECMVRAASSVRPESDSKPSTSSLSSSNVLYQVIATHPYEAEDSDELSFDAGDKVNVVEFDGEDEQDDGWLMGINVNTLAKGVFPANFTQKIEKGT